MSYTDAEERFIEATIPVLRAGERVLRETDRLEAATEASGKAAVALGTACEDPDYSLGLMLEAATRAGFADDSDVVKDIHASFDEMKRYMALMEKVAGSANEVLTPQNGGFEL